MNPPFKCLFCLETENSFKRVEHPVPESFGNDDTILEPGFVCDSCNEYFGSKVEREVASAPPFGIERVRAAVKTKRGKFAKYEQENLGFYSTGHWDHLIFSTNAQEILSLKPKNLIFSKNRSLFFPNSGPRDNINIARFLLKIGLELLIFSDKVDPYSEKFNLGRKFARYAPTGMEWELGYALYPRKEDLVVSRREDEIGPLETQTLYQYSIGQMQSSDIGFSFMYRTHIFSVNLSSPSLSEYIHGFNRMNEMKMNKKRVCS